MTNYAYKWLGGPAGLSSVHGGTHEWVVGEWVAVQTPVIPCVRGIHLCARDHVVSWCASALWVAEYDGEVVGESDKLVVERARVVRRVESWNDTTARLFAADCAERALLCERGAGREPDERSWAAIGAVRKFARGEISDAERAAARAAALDAAWAAERAAALDAERAAAWAAARAAALAAAWAAALDAALDAAWAAAWAAERAAAWAAARAAALDAAWAAERAAAWAAERAAAWAAAWAAERAWQTDLLFSAYLADATIAAADQEDTDA